MNQGMIYNIQRLSTEDGPGIRTTVFFKGCPLRCLWCSNPESQKRNPQLMFFPTLCVSCLKCLDVCENNAIRFENNSIIQDPTKCTHCGKCTTVCKTKAREITGKILTTAEILDIVKKDELFYHNSNGGVTFGGGEPTFSGEFFLETLIAAYNKAYHTAVDTCGYCSPDFFAKVIPYTNLFLFDCKNMDSTIHKKLTGVGNENILINLAQALESPCEVKVRMPLIPNKNDDECNIVSMAEFLKKYKHDCVEIMPFHSFGLSKYQALGLPYPDIQAYSPERLQEVLSLFHKNGLKTILV